MRSNICLAAMLVAAAPLSAQRPLSLDTLRVQVGARTSATLPVAVRSVEVIDRAQIDRLPAQTIADVLFFAQGVDVQARSPAQADVAVRGAAFEEVLVLVDGVRSSDVQTGHFDLDVAVPLDEVQRIEILRGPASAQYGSDAVGGVINIVTRRGGRPVEARLEGGSFATASGAIGGRVGTDVQSFRWGAEHIRSDGSRTGTDHRITQSRLGGEAPVAGGTLRADFAYAVRDFGAADFYAPFQSYEKTRTTTIAAGWVRSTGRFTIDPRLHARRHSDDFTLKRDDPAFYRNQHTTWQLGGELTGRLVLSQVATAAFGIEAAQDRIDSNALGNRKEARGAAFAEVEAGRIGSRVVQLGFRTDWHETYGSFIAPSVAAAVWPTTFLRLRASAGRSFRAPGWTERYYRDPANIGTPTLDPERAWAAELGAELTSDQSVRIDLVGFVRHADALIDWAKPAGAAPGTPFRTMNVEDATFTGLEASIEVLALRTRWTAAGTVLSLSADEATGFTSKYALRPLTQTALIGASRTFGRYAQFGVQARHGRRQPVALTPGSGEDDYLLLNARIALTVAAVRLHLDATNLLNDDYLDVSVRPGPGRAFRAGLTWALED